MVTKTLTAIRNHWMLLVICLVALILRMKGMTYQSLWVDELGAMNEANPSSNWKELFNSLRCCDIQPPLFFIIERTCFSVFGFSEIVAKWTVVIAGTSGVVAMYSLGKTMLNKPLGLFCATFTAINYFHIYYSQEVRPYVFAFLFATISFTCFILLLKSPTRKNQILYIVASLLLLYTHYYGIFVTIAQTVIVGIVCLFDRKNLQSLTLLKRFLFCAVCIAICYLPWLSFLNSAMHYQSGWIPDPASTFMTDYFYEYFGNSSFLNPILLLLLIVYVVHVSAIAKNDAPVTTLSNPLMFSFVSIVCWVFSVYLLPYLWSLLRTPMLQPRYTIVALPALLLALSFGVDFFWNKALRFMIIGLFVTLSLIQLILTSRYYTTKTKAQIREASAFIVKENSSYNFPIVNGKTWWYQQFYLTQYGSKAQLLTLPKEDFVDSVLTSSDPKYNVNGFWLSGAHGEKLLSTEKRQKLDSLYIEVKEQQYVNAFAQLFVKKSFTANSIKILDYTSFIDGTKLNETKQIALFSGTIHTKPIMLTKGSYLISIVGMGTKAAGQFAHVNVYLNKIKLGSYFLTAIEGQEKFSFNTPIDNSAVFSIELDNDYYAPPNDDRNAFLRQITIEKSDN